ncbi:hypothetical protein [Methylocystis echinoides]|uniref:hypothetical protein n=1 Tax=Methylocystis echinoides TaxID=29468 RepID=UPI0034493F84
MAESVSTPNRRTLLTGLAATPVVALPAVAGSLAGHSDELGRLIEAHKEARRIWLAALKRADAVVRPEIPSGLGHQLDDPSLTRNIAKAVLRAHYNRERKLVMEFEWWDADLARAAREKLDARELEYLANADRIFDEDDRAHEEERAAHAGETEALLALAAYPVRSLEEARRKAAYLLDEDLQDCLPVRGVAEQLLRSFVSADV